MRSLPQKPLSGSYGSRETFYLNKKNNEEKAVSRVTFLSATCTRIGLQYKGNASAGTAELVQRLSTGWTVRGSNPCQWPSGLKARCNGDSLRSASARGK
jgi:hypothetical protein